MKLDIEYQGKKYSVFVDIYDNKLWLHVKGQVAALSLDFAKIAAPLTKTQSKEKKEEKIYAPMTGRVIYTAEEENAHAIEEGDLLVVLEAMKMEYPVQAAQSGKVQFHCKRDQIIQQGTLLLTVLP